MVISQLVEFLKDAEKLAETYKNLESDIYNEVNFNTIYKTIPIEIQRTFNHNVSDPSLTHKERFKGFENFMEKECVSAGEGIRNIGGGSTREKSSYSSQDGNTDKKCTMLTVMIPIMIVAVNIAMESRVSKNGMLLVA